MPKVAGPDGLMDWNQLMEHASKDPHLHPAAAAIIRFKRKEIPPAFFRIFTFRPVNFNNFLSTGNSYGNGETEQDSFRSYVWIKANENIGKKGFIPSMALTLDHSIWMHNDKFRVDDWLLYENHSTIASGARTLIEGKLWTRDGRL
ncbi:Acyl-CoA thioesterase, partial [Oesophagostomum dentatum]